MKHFIDLTASNIPAKKAKLDSQKATELQNKLASFACIMKSGVNDQEVLNIGDKLLTQLDEVSFEQLDCQPILEDILDCYFYFSSTYKDFSEGKDLCANIMITIFNNVDVTKLDWNKKIELANINALTNKYENNTLFSLLIILEDHAFISLQNNVDLSKAFNLAANKVMYDIINKSKDCMLDLNIVIGHEKMPQFFFLFHSLTKTYTAKYNLAYQCLANVTLMNSIKFDSTHKGNNLIDIIFEGRFGRDLKRLTSYIEMICKNRSLPVCANREARNYLLGIQTATSNLSRMFAEFKQTRNEIPTDMLDIIGVHFIGDALEELLNTNPSPLETIPTVDQHRSIVLQGIKSGYFDYSFSNQENVARHNARDKYEQELAKKSYNYTVKLITNECRDQQPLSMILSTEPKFFKKVVSKRVEAAFDELKQSHHLPNFLSNYQRTKLVNKVGKLTGDFAKDQIKEEIKSAFGLRNSAIKLKK